MEDASGIMSVVESFDLVEHCPECGHEWQHDEPVHYGDCRYFFACEDSESEEDDGSDLVGWRSFKPLLL